MPKRGDDGHEWVGATTFPLPSTVVRMAHKRGIYRLREALKVDVMEVYCQACKRDYEKVAGKPCEAKQSREHLIGGPPGDQRRRRGPDGELLPRVASG